MKAVFLIVVVALSVAGGACGLELTTPAGTYTIKGTSSS